VTRHCALPPPSPRSSFHSLFSVAYTYLSVICLLVFPMDCHLHHISCHHIHRASIDSFKSVIEHSNTSGMHCQEKDTLFLISMSHAGSMQNSLFIIYFSLNLLAATSICESRLKLEEGDHAQHHLQTQAGWGSVIWDHALSLPWCAEIVCGIVAYATYVQVYRMIFGDILVR
jgi:hypothetical protein